jgi:glyoxalase/bleomycin resistance protein/dioxygenase superfamily protein
MTSILQSQDMYHTGILVPDLEAAMDRMIAVGGYHWTAIQRAELPIRLASGDQVMRLHYAYSLEAPHIELVQEVPGTPWTAARNVATHHIGYFCDDLSATSTKLEEAGFAREATAVIDGEPGIFAFHLGPSGERIEIVARSVMGDFRERLKGMVTQ